MSLEHEVHPVLSREELAQIAEFREKLQYKSIAETERLIFEWTKTGKLTLKQHVLLVRYHYQGY